MVRFTTQARKAWNLECLATGKSNYFAMKELMGAEWVA